MTKSDAISKLQEIDQILRDVGRYDNLPESQRSTLQRRAQRVHRDIDDVVGLLKKLHRDAKGD